MVQPATQSFLFVSTVKPSAKSQVSLRVYDVQLMLILSKVMQK